jgi:hypothetical protein
VRSALRHIFAVVPIDLSEFLQPLAELALTAPPAETPSTVDAILDMMISIFREEFFGYVHTAFALLWRHEAVRLFDISDFIANIICLGAEHLGRFAGSILDLAEQACGDWQDALDCAAYLAIVAAVGRILPAEVQAVLPKCVEYATLPPSVNGDGDLWPFVEFMTVTFPEEVARNEKLLTQFVLLAKAPGGFVGQMSLATVLGRERILQVLADIGRCEETEFQDMDSKCPVWYEADVVAVQYGQFLEAIQENMQTDESGE